jgi:hypothetical protein
MGKVGNRGFVLPNAFTADGNGKNDFFDIVASDTSIVRSMQLTIKDASGNLIYTHTKDTKPWYGYNQQTKAYYPPGKYHVDYNIVLADGASAEVPFEGHTCVSLLRTATAAKCVTPLEDWQTYVTRDTIDPVPLTTPYTSADYFCQQ